MCAPFAQSHPRNLPHLGEEVHRSHTAESTNDRNVAANTPLQRSPSTKTLTRVSGPLVQSSLLIDQTAGTHYRTPETQMFGEVGDHFVMPRCGRSVAESGAMAAGDRPASRHGYGIGQHRAREPELAAH